MFLLFSVRPLPFLRHKVALFAFLVDQKLNVTDLAVGSEHIQFLMPALLSNTSHAYKYISILNIVPICSLSS